jgi:protein-tyrosine-phosphatase
MAAHAERVLFICYGNIMRSAFAAAYFRRGAQGARPVEVMSAGYYPEAGRPADPRMIEAARRWGIELSVHRSRVVDAELVAWADVILVMDRANREALRQRFPGAADKIQFLGLLDEAAADLEIGDPYGGSARATTLVCDRIAGAVDRLLSLTSREQRLDAIREDGAPVSTR